MPLDSASAFDAAVAALAAVGIQVTSSATPPGDATPDLVFVDVNGATLAIEVKTAATVTPQSLHSTFDGRSLTNARGEHAQLLVADRVVAAARDILREHGWSWLDLRGHLHLSGPGVLVDTPVPAMDEPRGPIDTFSGKVALEVACALLLRPGQPASVRQLARDLGRSPSSISTALRVFREAQLVSSTGTPVIPELFWELASAWKPVSTDVARISIITDPAIANALNTGWSDAPNGTGWALTDTMAAAAYGAPAGVRAGYPPDFYVPDATTARRAETLLGVPLSPETRGATIRTAPVPQVCTHRHPAPPGGAPWPLAHPLFVALDLAGDRGRGAEILDAWTPPEGVTRVW